MARAKRTDRAEARRKYRAYLQAQEEAEAAAAGGAENPEAPPAGPGARTTFVATPKQAQPGARMGFLAAARAAAEATAGTPELAVEDFDFGGGPLGSEGATLERVGPNHFRVTLAAAPNQPT